MMTGPAYVAYIPIDHYLPRCHHHKKCGPGSKRTISRRLSKRPRCTTMPNTPNGPDPDDARDRELDF